MNTCIRYKYKHRIGHKNESLEDVEWFVKDDSQDNLDKQEKLDHLYFCIDKLHDADKSVLLLYLEDLSHCEIADIIGISENLVAVKMNRIRRKLFNCLT